MNSSRVFEKYDVTKHLKDYESLKKPKKQMEQTIDIGKCCDDVIRLFKDDGSEEGFFIPGTDE